MEKSETGHMIIRPKTLNYKNRDGDRTINFVNHVYLVYYKEKKKNL